MKCATCFREAKADPCENCIKLTPEERRLVHESLAPAVATITALNVAFGRVFGVPLRTESKHRTLSEVEAKIRMYTPKIEE